MTNPTMIVNASHPLPLGWEPDDLVDLWKVQPRHYLLYPRPMRLASCAAEAANELFAYAERQGLGDFMVLSAYRDGDCQAALFASSPDGYAARPGESEHQTGLAMDVAQFGRDTLLDDAHRIWLADNCWEHGFVVRYPEGREDVTGFPAEPWHLRYVGRDAALEMRNHGWVLEEWIARNVLATHSANRRDCV
jgi:D-alanyl-D-alanine carboxypeptidase